VDCGICRSQGALRAPNFSGFPAPTGRQNLPGATQDPV
jgi:hypothetical protein